MESNLERALHELSEPYLKGMNDEISTKLITTLVSRLEEFSGLEHDFIRVLHDIARMDEAKLYNREEYNHIIENFNNSIVIYFKSAGLFRVYTPEEFEKTFACHMRTYYRKKEVYEVVNDENPQKILIIIDSRDQNELNKIKQHILNYMRTLQEFPEEKIIVYDNTISNTYEIIIDKVVKNSEEKELFVSKLLKYIEQEENDAILSSKMSKRHVSKIPGAATYLIPDDELKKQLTGMFRENVGLVTPFNITINVTNNIETLNINNGSINNGPVYNGEVHVGPDCAEPIDDFIDHLESTKPKWYYKGNVIKYDTLIDEYIDTIGDCTQNKMTYMFKDILFERPFRRTVNGKRGTYIKLL